ncbi:MAG TPA: amino acid adenylation domain-containing protein, partial [Longimicrobium sp.]|nr:amino acid adenylation domain-containing protein [Longimicrobium sp.]
ELGALYAAFARGEGDPLPPLPVHYADYAAWQRRWVEGEVLEAQAAYWTAALAGAPEVLEIPTDRPRPARQDHAGGAVPVELDEALTARLAELGRRHGATLFMTVLAGWAATLGRLAGQDDVVVGTPAANRGRREIEGLIGFFVNTLALRVDLSGAPTVAELLGRVRARTLQAQQNQDIPFEQVVERVQPVRSLAHTPVFQAMLAWQAEGRQALELPGLQVGPVRGAAAATAKFDLLLALSATGGRIAGAVTYATSLFDRATVERQVGYLRRVLESMAADDQAPVPRLQMLPAAERLRVVEEWNATEAAYPADACLHELFQAQAARTPDAAALAFGDGSLAYAELNARANRLARHLVGMGVGPDVRVGVCMERTPDLVVGVLATLKAGGAYVPLDPAYPRERLRHMLADSAPAVLLTQGALAGSFAGEVPVVALDRDADRWAHQPAADPRPAGLTPDHLAYVIYTSGSTGTPKGVAIEHRSAVNFVDWGVREFAARGLDRTLLSTSLNFDLAVFELFVPLAAGATVRLVRDALELLRAPADVTLLNTVPSAIQALVEAGAVPAGVRTVNLAGEPLKQPLVERIFATTAVERVCNLYGPTETTTYSTWVEMRREDGFAPHVGRPLANTRVYVLDRQGEPVPPGAVGELYIGGAGVARGYLGRPALTAERFVPDALAARPGARAYRTGDLARWRSDGTIEFLGRNDTQVKVRGFRVELGEVEARLARHPAVRQAVVLAREDAPGERRLVAYCVGDALDADALRAHLAERLPEHMVPAAFVMLDALPLTPNGKTDRRALPAPGGDAYARRGFEAPVGETEVALAEVWAEVLGVEGIGRGDNFFELGGHSLLVVRLIERMRRRGLHAEVSALFTAPTLAELAAAVGSVPFEVQVPANGIPAGCEAITPEMLPLVELGQAEVDAIVAGVEGGAPNLGDVYPLAPLQEGILFHHLVAAEGDPYLLASVYAFDGRARLDAYLDALQAVIARHDVLRTTVAWEGLPEPVQVVWRQARLPVEEVEVPAGEGEAALRLYRALDPRRHRIDLRRAPLMRAYVARDAARDRWLLLLHHHHLVGDHVTLEVLQGEVQAHLAGRADELPAPLPFRSYVAQARLGVSQAEHEAFFREMLAEVDEPTAPFGLLDAWGDGAQVAEARLPVDGALAARLREQARRLGVSAASVFHLAWAQVLARASGREDVVFGTVLFGRMQGGEGADRVMGPFMNTLPLRVPAGARGVEASVRETHARLAGLLRHEHASLALAQRCSGVAAPAPLFTALLNYRHSTPRRAAEAAGSGPAGSGRIYGEERTNYPVALTVDDRGEGFGLKAQVPASVGPERVCAMVNRALEGLVEALERTPERPVSRVDVLAAAERAQVLEGWNRTEAAYPASASLHELFQAQAARTPDAPALVFQGDALTYAELNARANRLAHHLIARGVGPDVRVALCVERGAEMLVGLLAVLKAGGAYVPLDPSHPEERLGHILADAAPAVLLTQASLAERFAGESPRILIDTDAHAWADEPASDPARATLPDHLAYVIYTSGSTGRPKGVMNTHRGVINLLCSIQQSVGMTPADRLIAVTTLSFDISVLELFLPLLHGARVEVLDRATAAEPSLLAEAIGGGASTVMQATPATWRMLVDGGWAGAAELRALCGGEALPGELAARLVERVGALWNVYGPTETTIWSTVQAVGAAEAGARGAVAIGAGAANTRLYVLDRAGEPVPVGVAGELHIAGDGLARGYFGRPGLTAERFVPEPFGAVPGARMYRTGDLVRWKESALVRECVSALVGESPGAGHEQRSQPPFTHALTHSRTHALEFVGRNDAQVKVRGYRIELGEIEARLLEHDAVREAAVVARADAGGDTRLVAYHAGAPVQVEALRAHLAERLPKYMVPAAYVALDALPLTPNGKLDRRALPAPGGEAFARQAYEAPAGEAEAALAEIWSE